MQNDEFTYQVAGANSPRVDVTQYQNGVAVLLWGGDNLPDPVNRAWNVIVEESGLVERINECWERFRDTASPEMRAHPDWSEINTTLGASGSGLMFSETARELFEVIKDHFVQAWARFKAGTNTGEADLTLLAKAFHMHVEELPPYEAKSYRRWWANFHQENKE